MRIKFKKGIPPESLAMMLFEIIKERDMVIGSVNVYIQEYGEDMKPIKFDDEYLVVEAAGITCDKYTDYVVSQRRKKMKAVI